MPDSASAQVTARPLLPSPVAAALLQDGRLYAILAAAGFSLKAVFVKLAYLAGPVDALTLLTMRMLLALPLFAWLALAAPAGSQPLDRRTLLQIALLACIGYYLSSLYDFIGLSYIGTGLERLILYVYPTIVVLLGAWFQRQRPARQLWQALALCYLGLLLAFGHDLGQHGDSGDVLIGGLWIFAAAFVYALYMLGVGELIGKVGSLRLTGLAGVASCLWVLAHCALFGAPQKILAMPAGVWLNAALMALLSTVLPIWWLAQAIQRLGPGQAATAGSIGPVLTMLAAWLLLGESVSALQLGGMVLVMFGVARIKR